MRYSHGYQNGAMLLFAIYIADIFLAELEENVLYILIHTNLLLNTDILTIFLLSGLTV